MFGFQLGASENYSTAEAFVDRLICRGCRATKAWPLLAVLDRSDTLRKAQAAEAAIEVLEELDRFLVPKNLAARDSLHEAEADLALTC